MQLALRDVPLLDVGHRLAARSASPSGSPADGRRFGRGDVLLQVLLGLVLGVLVQLHAPRRRWRRLALAERDEVVAVHAHLERALVAVERRAPGILRVGRCAPGAVLPDHRQVAEVERGRLRVGDVRLAAPSRPGCRRSR